MNRLELIQYKVYTKYNKKANRPAVKNEGKFEHIERISGNGDIYPKSCTSEYCGMLTSSGKCEMIENKK